MMPYIFKIGNFELRFYSVMIIIGLLITIFMSQKKARELDMNPDHIERLVIVTFLCGLIGARAYYVIYKWDFYSLYPSEIIKVWHGGLAIHGGVVLGFIGALIYSRLVNIKILTFTDILAPWILLAQGLGRFGNFANGEAHGVPTITPPSIIFSLKPNFRDFWQSALDQLKLINTPTQVSQIKDMIASKGAGLDVHFAGKLYSLHEYVPWGISFSNKYMPAAYQDFGTLPVHPTFFYEMILNFLGAFIMYRFWRKNKYISTGMVFGIYLLARIAGNSSPLRKIS